MGPKQIDRLCDLLGVAKEDRRYDGAKPTLVHLRNTYGGKTQWLALRELPYHEREHWRRSYDLASLPRRKGDYTIWKEFRIHDTLVMYRCQIGNVHLRRWLAIIQKQGWGRPWASLELAVREIDLCYLWNAIPVRDGVVRLKAIGAVDEKCWLHPGTEIPHTGIDYRPELIGVHCPIDPNNVEWVKTSTEWERIEV